ncbi:hypothetical protein [Roseibium sediminicola]|uniref:Oxidoreductase molybdopterin-binding domain-containing protein n=1 Tax=Roseibium sediminicola TaxID=2933272 RepID=A0ABT0GMC7_9HYPH|nr:hypothetical protein [Roseibium sp. CAU 1639]MCK7610576.1 hypothetical protein [Roseibium sp. CAU 1639]
MIRQVFLILSLALGVATPAFSADGETTILVIQAGQTLESREISVAEIEKAGLQEVQAFNPYEKRIETYSGVWMQDFVAAFGTAETSSLTTRAIDDYEITFSKEEWQGLRILIATRVDGEYIDFDRKGPMRIIFPDYDEKHKDYQTNLPKWTWMITEIAME